MNPLKVFYNVKPLVPRSLQLHIRKLMVRNQLRKHENVWPIDSGAGAQPENWNGWPEGRRFAFALMHDVDTARGHAQAQDLAEIEKSLGLRSLFSFVPERYPVSRELRESLSRQGFEIGVHGLTHDGKLFSSLDSFRKSSVRINEYIRSWNTVGFSSPSMHHNLAWMHLLNIRYAISTFDTDPFEPQPDGVRTIFPLWVSHAPGEGYVELPYTLPQDFTLFVLMGERTLDIWKKKIDWIAQRGGMALVNSHPDYMDFSGLRGAERYPARLYREFLTYVKEAYAGQYWHARPAEVAQFWRGAVVTSGATP